MSLYITEHFFDIIVFLLTSNDPGATSQVFDSQIHCFLELHETKFS